MRHIFPEWMQVPAFLVIVYLAVSLFSRPGWFRDRDDTDPPDGRSGMHPHTDHATGCQYLSGPYGGITPRLAASGVHMGCER